jgi:hypothetical protein
LVVLPVREFAEIDGVETLVAAVITGLVKLEVAITKGALTFADVEMAPTAVTDVAVIPPDEVIEGTIKGLLIETPLPAESSSISLTNIDPLAIIGP